MEPLKRLCCLPENVNGLPDCLLLQVATANGVAFIHAYKFTHFTSTATQRTDDPEHLSFGARIGLLFTGIDNPRPAHKAVPVIPYETVWVQASQKLECWLIKSPAERGTVILFHGYAGEKSSLLERAAEFSKLGFSTFMVDFSGSGGSQGNGTSIGYNEAAEVNACMDYIQSKQTKPIILFGTSMGAAAILKAMKDYPLKPAALVLECPFGSLYKTVCARFDIMVFLRFPWLGCFVSGAVFRMVIGRSGTIHQPMQRPCVAQRYCYMAHRMSG